MISLCIADSHRDLMSIQLLLFKCYSCSGIAEVEQLQYPSRPPPAVWSNAFTSHSFQTQFTGLTAQKVYWSWSDDGKIPLPTLQPKIQFKYSCLRVTKIPHNFQVYIRIRGMLLSPARIILSLAMICQANGKRLVLWKRSSYPRLTLSR